MFILSTNSIASVIKKISVYLAFSLQNDTCILFQAETRFSLPIMACSYKIEVSYHLILLLHSFTLIVLCM